MALTVTFKKVDGLELELDVYPPQELGSEPVPAAVYYHGGGLTVGDRSSWFPTWLHARLSKTGIALISADYRLLPPAAGHEILEDVCDALAFVTNGGLNTRLSAWNAGFSVDCNAVAVAGTSSGGLCAYLAAAHGKTRGAASPKALLSMYGMGANFLTPHYLVPKTEPFFRGRELLDPDSFADFLHPRTERLPPISVSPLVYHPNDSSTPGYPANPRMQLARLYLQMGNFLDYYTGQHEPSLSAALRDTPHEDAVPAQHRRLFPQFNVSTSWPPTLICHGEDDTAVPVVESIHLRDLLHEAGVPVDLRIIPGREHSFDYALGVEDELGGVFDDIVRWLVERLRS
ncbi:alpha/beta-hydrolase [Schizophyllum commune Loenen D]|nr:alpha/beta-hydrolase [Schizophyllum commune Loenen D]